MLALCYKQAKWSGDMSNTPTLAQLQRGLQISQQIAALEAELKAIFTGKAVTAPVKVAAVKPAAVKKRKGRMSAQGRANIVAAQKARWAKAKAGGKKGKVKSAPKAAAAPKAAKRKPMSAAAKARLAALMKARWAAAKAGTGPVPTTPKT